MEPRFCTWHHHWRRCGAVSSAETRNGRISPITIDRLRSLGIEDAGKAFNPDALFGPETWSNPWALAVLLVGGVLVGFGTRWANGCTSGHAISGLSSFQWPSVIAAFGFFLGGYIASHFFLPALLPLL